MAEIISSIKIKAPFDIVFDMTNDIENWPNLFTEYKEARIILKEDNYILFELTTKPLLNQGSRSWVSERYLFKEKKYITARRIEPLFPFKRMNIKWYYCEVNDMTEMIWVQEFEVDPKLGFTEEQVVHHLNKTSQEQLTAIKANIEKAVEGLHA